MGRVFINNLIRKITEKPDFAEKNSSKRSFNQSGIALILVLAAVAVLTTSVTEFAYNTNINYHLALNEKERIQAYYLAQSGYRFMILELKFDRVYRSMVSKYNLGQYLGSAASMPLCQQIPISTALIRGVFLGDTGAGAAVPEGEQKPPEGAPPEGEAGAEEGGVPAEFKKMVSMSDREGAKEFLSFEGDFDGQCTNEGTKISLNGFNGLSAVAAPGEISDLDKYKMFFQRFLEREEFKKYFPETAVRPSEITDSISDWVDEDEIVNRPGGRTGGAEVADYEREGLKYPVHNGKLLTLDEAYLIQNVTSDWFSPMMDRFTVYADNKINPCSADASVVETLIRVYVESTPGLPPIKIADEEARKRLIDGALQGCASGASGAQLVTEVAKSFATAIGAEAAGEATPTTIATDFAKMLSAENTNYALALAGTVGDITVRVKAVVDTQNANPRTWPLLYWRIY